MDAPSSNPSRGERLMAVSGVHLARRAALAGVAAAVAAAILLGAAIAVPAGDGAASASDGERVGRTTRTAAGNLRAPTAGTECGSGTSASRAAATWPGSRARRTVAGSRPSTSRAPTGQAPGASSPADWSPTCTPAICGSAGGSSSTAPIPAPRRGAARGLSGRAPTAW